MNFFFVYINYRVVHNLQIDWICRYIRVHLFFITQVPLLLTRERKNLLTPLYKHEFPSKTKYANVDELMTSENRTFSHLTTVIVIFRSGSMLMRFKMCCFEFMLRDVMLVRPKLGAEFSASVWDRCQTGIVRNWYLLILLLLLLCYKRFLLF